MIKKLIRKIQVTTRKGPLSTKSTYGSAFVNWFATVTLHYGNMQFAAFLIKSLQEWQIKSPTPYSFFQTPTMDKKVADKIAECLAEQAIQKAV